MNRVHNNSNHSSSYVARYPGIPIPVPQQYKVLQRRGFFRSVGVFLSLCKDYVGPDTDVLKKAGLGIVSGAREKKIEEAVKTG